MYNVFRLLFKLLIVIKMKRIKKIRLIATTLLFVLAACHESELISHKVIEGNYIGTLTKIDSPGETILNIEEDAISEITKIGNETIQVHINSVEVDTTFMLNYYEDINNIRVCFTNDEFENMYGHMLGQGHNSGGMMDDMQNNETDWMHHLNDEHQNGDEHFGSFDMLNNIFEYRFEITEGGLTHNMIFQGGR